MNKHQLDVGLQTKPNKTDVLLLDGTSHIVGDLDLRGNKIILPGEIQMDRKLITNLDTDENQDLSAVNMITLKNKVEPKADKDYVDFEITKQNALINNTFVKKTGDQMNGDLILPHDSYPVEGNTNKAISYETQREIFLSRRESFPMQADINMNNNFIQNIATPTSSHQVTNKGYSPSGQQTDVFRYLMEDADHSSSENNIVVTGIVDFAASPHVTNKKAYEFTLVKDTDGSNDYRSRIGFNLYSLPLGYYTIIIEYMPPEMTNVIVTVQGTTINIASQTTKTFDNYTKTLIKFHNWRKSTPDYLFINLHGKTTSSTTGHLIVYGVKGYVS